MKLCILTKGKSSESEVSLMSHEYVVDTIKKLGHDYSIIYANSDDTFSNDDCLSVDLITYIKDNKFDGVFITLHGSYGEDGRIQGMLDYYDIPYTGCSVLTSSIGIDKDFSKKIAMSNNVPVTPSITIDYTDFNANHVVQLAISKLNLPVFIKAVNQGSTFGVYKAITTDEIIKYIHMASKYSDKILIEKCIIGRELEVAVITKDNTTLCSPVGEIVARADFYDYNAKYSDDSSTELIIPAKLDNNISEKIKEYAKKVYESINGDSYSRVDFFLEEETNEIYFNEINTLPGMTKHSMFPMLLREYGLSDNEIITIILDNMIKGRK